MISRWPAYSWRVTVPSGVTISVTANGTTESLTLAAGTYRGLGASGTLMGALAACLDTHTQIGSVAVSYVWTEQVAEAVLTCSTTVGPVVINSATGFSLSRLGLVAGSSWGSNLTTTQFVRPRLWDGLWSVYGSRDIDFAREFQASRVSSRFSPSARTQVALSESITASDRFLLVPGRYIDPRYAALAAYAEAAGTVPGLTSGTLADLIAAQLAGQRDTGPGISTTAWLWRHTSDSDLAGTAIDLMIPPSAFGLDALAQRSSSGGRRYTVTVPWQAAP
jgi:hypothetical protein